MLKSFISNIKLLMSNDIEDALSATNNTPMVHRFDDILATMLVIPTMIDAYHTDDNGFHYHGIGITFQVELFSGGILQITNVVVAYVSSEGVPSLSKWQQHVSVSSNNSHYKYVENESHMKLDICLDVVEASLVGKDGTNTVFLDTADSNGTYSITPSNHTLRVWDNNNSLHNPVMKIEEFASIFNGLSEEKRHTILGQSGYLDKILSVLPKKLRTKQTRIDILKSLVSHLGNGFGVNDDLTFYYMNTFDPVHDGVAAMESLRDILADRKLPKLALVDYYQSRFDENRFTKLTSILGLDDI